MLKKLTQFSFSLVALVLFVGCPAEQKEDYQSYNEADQNTDAHGHDHDHHHEGPHGGHVIELTDDHSAHLEVVMENDRSIMLYVLGSDLETAVPVKVDEIEFELDEEDGNEVELELTPKPLDGEPEGTSSVFMVAADKVPEAIEDIEGLHGHVHITIDGTEYVGHLEHDHDHDHEHEGEDHDHEKEEKAKEGEAKPEGESKPEDE